MEAPLIIDFVNAAEFQGLLISFYYKGTRQLTDGSDFHKQLMLFLSHL